MVSQTKFDAINRACANLNKAKSEAWNRFAYLNNNALHRQPEVVLLGLDLETLHEARALFREDIDSEEGLALLECARDTVLRNLSNTVFAITEVAANSQLDAEERCELKHSVEGNINRAARCIRQMFAAFGIETLSDA